MIAIQQEAISHTVMPATTRLSVTVFILKITELLIQLLFSRDRSYTTWTQSASLCFMFTNPQVDSNILQRCDCENFISAVVISSITTNRCSICMMSQLAQTGFPMWYIVACASSSVLFSSIINWSRIIRSALFRNL